MLQGVTMLQVEATPNLRLAKVHQRWKPTAMQHGEAGGGVRRLPPTWLECLGADGLAGCCRQSWLACLMEFLGVSSACGVAIASRAPCRHSITLKTLQTDYRGYVVQQCRTSPNSMLIQSGRRRLLVLPGCEPGRNAMPQASLLV